MSQYKRYPTYKDSGVEWLGEVPKHWNIAPLKHWLSRNDGGVWGEDPDSEDDPIVLRSTEQGVGGEWQISDPARRKLIATDYAKALLIEGDLLVTKSSGSELHIGKTSLVTTEIAALNPCYSNFMQRLRVSDEVSPNYIHYILNNKIAREQLAYLSNSTTGLANLNGGVIGQMLLCGPEKNEQEAIVRFLDRETARIDALIEKKQRLNELLKEKRQAVITQAVTKGLDPNVPMKDSGVEWLGEVPEHWEIKQVRHLVSFVGGGTPSKENLDYWQGDIPWVSPKDMKTDFISSAQDNISLQAVAESSTKLIDKGAVLIVVRGMILLHSVPVAMSEVKLTINQDMKALIPNKVISSKYLLYLLKGFRDVILSSVDSSAHGTRVLPTDALSRLQIALPSLEEQTSIIRFIESQLARFDRLMEQNERSIELLQEHRSGLITAAVTGQIDVRDAVSTAA